MRKYEIMYILNSSLEEEARQELMETLHNIIVNDGGSVDKVDDWGMKEFAYRIEDMTKGYYVVINVTAEPDAIKEFDRICRINNNVVRTMIVNLDNK
ncbi:MAG: 30S ribosomal protein S6 [Erysipelotrichaceae bacterium]|nr:30S ribosomal protein S6 [Erysipelotrichaceae bacterium]MBR5049222.1 30S ribosomal protein S6 [Erysipelotrichaceae bacterium]